MITVWIISWSYFDGSGAGIIGRAYADEEEARWLANMLSEYDTSRVYYLQSLEVKS